MHVYFTRATQVIDVINTLYVKRLKGGFTGHMYMYVCILHVKVYSHSVSFHALGPAKMMGDGWVGHGRRF